MTLRRVMCRCMAELWPCARVRCRSVHRYRAKRHIASVNRPKPTITIAVAAFSAVNIQSIVSSVIIQHDDDNAVEFLHTLKSGKQNKHYHKPYTRQAA